MYAPRKAPALAAALLLALMAACASMGPMDRNESPEGEAVAVRVDNNLIPPTDLTVWLVSESGIRDMIGGVSANETETLSSAVSGGGQYRLVAETTAGRRISSRTFHLAAQSRTVQWNVSSNAVSFAAES